MTTNELMLQLFKSLKSEMNGAVVGSMKDHGMEYNLSYGVSIPTIKKIAMSYFPDHALAMLLIRQDVRELRIAAVYIDEFGFLDGVAMNEWSGVFTTAEMVEQSCMNLLWKSEIAHEKSLTWCTDERPLFIKAGFLIAGKLAHAGMLNDCQMEGYFPLVKVVARMDNLDTKSSAVYALRKIAMRSKSMNRKVLALVDELSQMREESAKDIAQETGWQLDYI